MKFFADTADIAEIKACQDMGLVDGVTTNPSIIAKSGRKFKEVIAEICSFVPGPVSAEVAALDYEGMVREGNELRKIAKNVAIKVPLTPDGLKACRFFTGEGTMVNVTLCFSANQALLAAKSGATLISRMSAISSMPGRLMSSSRPMKGEMNVAPDFAASSA